MPCKYYLCSLEQLAQQRLYSSPTDETGLDPWDLAPSYGPVLWPESTQGLKDLSLSESTLQNQRELKLYSFSVTPCTVLITA